jgi:hypothetical protein
MQDVKTNHSKDNRTQSTEEIYPAGTSARFISVGGKPKNRLGNRSVGYPQAQEPCGGYTRHGRERYQEQKL